MWIEYPPNEVTSTQPMFETKEPKSPTKVDRRKTLKVDTKKSEAPKAPTVADKQPVQPSSLSAGPTKSFFIAVLKDLGLRDIVHKHNLPEVLSAHQFGEALFTMLFAPSCPVICDPTGEM